MVVSRGGFKESRAFSLHKTGSGFRYQFFSQLVENIPKLPETFPISKKKKKKKKYKSKR